MRFWPGTCAPVVWPQTCTLVNHDKTSPCQALCQLVHVRLRGVRDSDAHDLRISACSAAAGLGMESPRKFEA